METTPGETAGPGDVDLSILDATDLTFANFAEALAFTNRVGVLAEAEDHHPGEAGRW